MNVTCPTCSRPARLLPSGLLANHDYIDHSREREVTCASSGSTLEEAQKIRHVDTNSW